MQSVFSTSNLVAGGGTLDKVEFNPNVPCPAAMPAWRLTRAFATGVSILAILCGCASVGGREGAVSAHPTVKMLALDFLVVIGVVLIAEGFEHHVPKGYIYFAMAFSVAVEALNLRMRRHSSKPVKLKNDYES